ncbi:MAG: hypothetical protein ABR584_05325 [Candidatus Baltobacteraceae bacterium]
MNFVALGAMILFVFSTQVIMATKVSERGMPLYFGAYGTVYLMLGILYLLGAHRRRAFLSDFDYRSGLRRGARTTCVAAAMLVIVLGLHIFGFHVRTLGYVIGIPFASSVISMRIMERIWPQLKNPKGSIFNRLAAALGVAR